MEEKTRVLLVTDGIWTPSGFGTVCKNISYGLRDQDVEVAILSWQFVGMTTSFDNIKVYPIKDHTFGADQIQYVIQDFRPHYVITLGDMWMVNYMANDGNQKVLKDFKAKWIWYLPIDSDNIPAPFMAPILKADCVVAMSKHGGKVLEAAGVPHEYIPHGVDTAFYKPIDKEEARKGNSQYKDKFIIGCVARNQDRKQYARLIRAFSLFAKDKDDTFLHVHADPVDSAGLSKDFNGQAFSVLLLSISYYGMSHKVYFTEGIRSFNSGIGSANMVNIYNMFDIHALSTTGEGFGLPIIESMACGIPNVITDYTSTEELIKGRGEPAKVKATMLGSFGTIRAIVDEEDMAEKFEKLYQDWKNGGLLLKQYSNDCVKFAQDYDWKKVVIPAWVNLFKKLGDKNASTQ